MRKIAERGIIMTTQKTNNQNQKSAIENQKGEITMTTATKTSNATAEKIQKINAETMKLFDMKSAERYDLADLNQPEGMAYYLYLEVKRTIIAKQNIINSKQKEVNKALEEDCLALYKDLQKQLTELQKEKAKLDKIVQDYAALKITRIPRVALYHFGTKKGNTLVLSDEDTKRLDSVLKNIQNLAENHMEELSKADMDKDFHSAFYRNAKAEVQQAWNILLPDEKNIPNAENMSALIADISVYRTKLDKDTNINIGTNNTEIKKIAGIKRVVCRLLATKIAERDVYFAKRDALDNKAK